MSHDDQSTQIQQCLVRLRSGDESARDELLARASERLSRLTRKMLRDFPGVQRWEQADDVLQNAALRLCRALGDVRPETGAEFFRLAALQIRRELIDLARRYSGAQGLGANHDSLAGRGKSAGESSAAAPDPSDTTHDPDRLAAWSDFHLEAESLPEEEREVFDMLFYQGLSKAEAAAVLDVSDRTIKRRWQSARLRLAETLGGRMPGL